MIILTGTGCQPSVRYTRTGRSTKDVKVRPALPPLPEQGNEREFLQTIEGYIGIPYRYGGMERSGLDCSGLVCLVFGEVYNIKLPHSTRKLRRYGKRVSLRNAALGDLVFFKKGLIGGVNHVGIYLGNRTFVHASTRKGVTYSSLDNDYYRKRLAELRRIFQ